jgi:hypothetical protein
MSRNTSETIDQGPANAYSAVCNDESVRKVAEVRCLKDAQQEQDDADFGQGDLDLIHHGQALE